MNKGTPDNNTEAELAEEFREYLGLIGNEISDPLKEQVDKHSDYVKQLSMAIEKLEKELQKDIQLSLKKQQDDLKKHRDDIQKQQDETQKQVIKIYSHQQSYIKEIYSHQQSQISTKLDAINQGLQKKIDDYEKKTTQRLMKHRWIEILIIFFMLTVIFLVNQ